MAERYLSLVAPRDLIEDLHGRLATVEGVEVSTIVAAASDADALDAPIGSDKVKKSLAMITVVLELSTAGLGLANEVHDTLADHPTAVVVVRDPGTGATRETLSGESTPEKVKDALSP